MQNLSLFLMAILGFTGSLQAGEPVAYKQVAPASQEFYGTGFYGAIDLGANLFQDRGGTTTFTDQFDRFTTDTVKIHPDNDVGFFGGIKLGYIFGTGILRPTLKEISFTTALMATPISNCVKCSIRVPEFLDAKRLSSLQLVAAA